MPAHGLEVLRRSEIALCAPQPPIRWPSQGGDDQEEGQPKSGGAKVPPDRRGNKVLRGAQSQAWRKMHNPYKTASQQRGGDAQQYARTDEVCPHVHRGLVALHAVFRMSNRRPAMGDGEVGRRERVAARRSITRQGRRKKKELLKAMARRKGGSMINMMVKKKTADDGIDGARVVCMTASGSVPLTACSPAVGEVVLDVVHELPAVRAVQWARRHGGRVGLVRRSRDEFVLEVGGVVRHVLAPADELRRDGVVIVEVLVCVSDTA